MDLGAKSRMWGCAGNINHTGYSVGTGQMLGHSLRSTWLLPNHLSAEGCAGFRLLVGRDGISGPLSNAYLREAANPHEAHCNAGILLT